MHMNRAKLKKSITAAVLAAVMILSLMLAGCSGQSGAELKVTDDLESMRYVELDPKINAELEGLLSDQGREYYEMFLGKAGEFDYAITGADKTDDGTVVHVRITTYDFASEYLRSWTEFLEPYENDDSKKAGDGKENFDSAQLYETLFRNLSGIAEKKFIADVDINCEEEDGKWHTDAATNAALRDAILGGMLSEMSTLAGL
jgi:hypothetical protein